LFLRYNYASDSSDSERYDFENSPLQQNQPNQNHPVQQNQPNPNQLVQQNQLNPNLPLQQNQSNRSFIQNQPNLSLLQNLPNPNKPVEKCQPNLTLLRNQNNRTLQQESVETYESIDIPRTKSSNNIDSLILENGLLTKLKKSVTSVFSSLKKSLSMVYFADTTGSTSTKQQSNIQQEQSNVRHLSIDDDVVYEKTVPAKCGSKSQTSSIQQRLSNEVIFEGAFAGNGEKKR
jgi:hypothetical protein